MFVRKIVINLKRKLKFSQNTLVQKNSDNPVQIIFFALFFFFEMFSKRLKNLASFSQLNIISVVNDRSDRSRFPTKPDQVIANSIYALKRLDILLCVALDGKRLNFLSVEVESTTFYLCDDLIPQNHLTKFQYFKANNPYYLLAFFLG